MITSTLVRRLRQGVALGRLLRVPGAAAALRSWRPFSITSFQMLRTLDHLGLRPATVIDGGANVGQFARATIETFPAAQVVAIEALPDVARTLASNLAGEPRARIEATALGAESGRLRFYRAPYDLASSALRPLDDAGVTEEEVPVARLDDLVDPDRVARPLLVKLDLQGYEAEALRGAERTLAIADYVLVEVSFEETYEGETRFDILQSLLAKHGFQFSRPVEVLRDRDGRIVEMDALFVRADALSTVRGPDAPL